MKKKIKNSPSRILVPALSLLFLFFTIFTLLAKYVGPSKMLFLQYFAVAAPIIAIVNILFLFVALLLYRRALPIVAISILLSINFSQLNYKKRSWVKRDKKEEEKLLIATYNVNYFSNENQFNATKIASMVEKEGVTLLALQEFEAQSNYNLQELITEFDFFPYKAIYSSKKSGIGMALFSRFPIVRSRKITFPSSQNGYMWADILYRGDTIRLFNCHLQTTGFYRNIDQGYRALKRGTGENFIIREEQSRRVREAIDTTSFPLLVCGDFNDSPCSFTYNTIKGNDLYDSKRGLLWRGSYRWTLSLLRIDYILHSKEFYLLSHRVGKRPYSDHKPIFVELEYQN
ncbi:MAG: endonuclease/exonuclease/phosphatase family protein [Bacteroidales bacterium]